MRRKATALSCSEVNWCSCLLNTHRGRAGAAQLVLRLEVGPRTVGGGALLGGKGGLVEGLDQQVVKATVGAVVRGRCYLHHVCSAAQGEEGPRRHPAKCH